MKTPSLAFPAMALLLVFASPAISQDQTWQAGSARIKITPDKLIFMSGYGSRDHPAEGKLTDLWAKALALRDPLGNRAVVITLDLIGLDRGMSQQICGQLQEKHDLQRRQIAICTSHTHTGPAVGRNLAPLHYLLLDEDQQSAIDSYTEKLIANIIQVVDAAIAAMEPSRLSWGRCPSCERPASWLGPPTMTFLCSPFAAPRENSRQCSSATPAIPRCLVFTSGQETIQVSPRLTWSSSNRA